MVNINEILKDKQSWENEYERIYDFFKDHIGEKGCFRKIVKIKIDKNEKELLYTDYLVNLIMWKPMVNLKMKPKINQIFDCSNIKASNISKYINDTYIRPLRGKEITNKVNLNLELAELIEELKSINENFGLLLGIHYNLYQIINEMKQNPEFKELLETKIPYGLQPKEIETFLNEKLQKLIKILSKSDTGFAPLINSGAGINLGQLKELLLPIGNKPDLDGYTFPVPINTSILMGLDTPTHYYIDATGGRKALIMNKSYTGRSRKICCLLQ